MSAERCTLKIEVSDGEQVRVDLSEIERRLNNSPVWLQWLIVQLIESRDHGIDLVHTDLADDSASVTSKCRLRLQLSQQLRMLLTALRASQGDGEFRIECEGSFGPDTHFALLRAVD